MSSDRHSLATVLLAFSNSLVIGDEHVNISFWEAHFLQGCNYFICHKISQHFTWDGVEWNCKFFRCGSGYFNGYFWYPIWLVTQYHNKAEEYPNLKLGYDEQVAINTTQQERIQHLAEWDTKQLQELANAKSKLDELSDTLRANTKRVYIKAECSVSETAFPSGVDGSRPARLAKDAEQDYVRLLGELETLEAQFLGLREWAKTECGRKQ
ncbi:lysis protein [Xenorhabdus sp. BG5]|uniref:lysis protein n=1 Tax=Xenorhabdus sp. BG5 TaxID=2782014 RepID=UPI0030DA0384